MQNEECRMKKRVARWFVLLALLSSGLAALAADLASLCADRAAIERVYYQHRLGEKPPFEQVLPPATLENLVRQDLRKEAALKQAYGVEVTPAMLDAEVQRINTTTRAPDMLAEIKTALGNDPARFANVFAKPILVERLLREKFDNDDALHATQRRQAEKVRERLLQLVAADVSRRTMAPSERERRLTSAATNDLVAQLVAALRQTHSNEVSKTTWQLGARPAETNAPAADEIEIKKRFGPNAQILSSPRTGDGEERKFYFADLPGELQKVLRVQLRQPGDVSAVIETLGGFLLYVAKEKTDAVLSVAGLSLPKRSYDQWLEEQSENKP
jgi:23S rRNA U2552 (ribose-2'-O)-methylase RlmE/FtsJ